MYIIERKRREPRVRELQESADLLQQVETLQQQVLTLQSRLESLRDIERRLHEEQPLESLMDIVE